MSSPTPSQCTLPLPHYPTVAPTSLIPPADSARPPFTPLPWNTSSSPVTSVLCSRWRPLSSALCPSLPVCSAFFPPLPQLWMFATVITLFDLFDYVISGFQSKECWDWTPPNQHQPPACALRHNNMAFLYWHGLHIKNYINDKTFYNVLFSLAVSFLPVYPLNALTCTLHIYILMLFMPWKKSLRVLKILRIQTLLSCHAMWIYFLLSLWGAWFKINQTFGFATGPPAWQNVVFTWTALFPSASDL